VAGGQDARLEGSQYGNGVLGRGVPPEWSGCRWVNTIDAGRAPGPNTDSAAATISVSLPDQPASTSV